MTYRRIVLLVAGLSLVACGGEPAPSTAPTVTSFQATPPSVLAGGATILSWTVSGDAPITLALTPGVGDVSGSNTAQVTPSATISYTLTATNAVGSDSDQVTVAVQQVVALRGTVIGLNGLPAGGVDVAVAGRPAGTTGSDGRFDAGTVPVPYDVSLHDASAQRGTTYLGLTIAEPTLLMLGPVTGPQHQTVVQGAVSGGFGYPEPSDGWTQVSFGSNETRLSRRATAATGGFEFDPLPWFGPLQTEGSLHALQWRVGASGMPTSYSGYAHRPATLRSTVPAHAGQELALLPIGQGLLSGTTRLPPGHTPLVRTLSEQFESGATMVLGAEWDFSETFSYPTPRLDDGTATLLAMSTGPSESGSMAVLPGLPDTSGGLELTLPAPSILDEPADGAAGIDPTTTFRWSSPAPRVHLVRFHTTGGPTFDVVTDATATTLPDLDALGLPLSEGTTYDWRVYGLEPYPHVDAVAATDDAFLSAWWTSAFYEPVRAATWSQSARRSFTTAP